MIDIFKQKILDIDTICKIGKKKGLSYKQMAEHLGISRQRLHQFREYHDRIYALQFLELCELCGIDISNYKWKEYVKEIDIEKEINTKREKERLGIQKERQEKMQRRRKE